jgi:peptidoglycan/xylan/chitin deacetylase (PgdA/CDA1 family)
MTPELTSRSVLAIALLFGAPACSDSDDPTPANGGSGGALGGSGGAAGTGGSAGSGGASGSGGSAGASGSGGSAGSAGAGGSAGAAGAAGAAGDGGGDAGVGDDASFPVPDKLVALTFDDGPDNQLTGAVLDKLEAHDVPASFFLVGQSITEANAPVLERAAALGATFENHSNDFNSLVGQSTQDIQTAVNSTSALIEQFTGGPPAFFRAPNLAADATVFAAIDLPFARGVVGLDFPAEFGGNPTVEGVSQTVLSQVQDGSIVLLHDVQPGLNPQPTPPALDIIIPELKRQGYEFVTIRELFARRGVDPNTLQDGHWDAVPPN